MSWGPEAGSDREPEQEHADTAADDALALFDLEELNIDWSAWLPGVDYTATVREAEAGEAALRTVLRRLKRPGSRMRTQCLSTREGEPVLRVDLHPDGWRELADLAADGERYRRLRRRNESA